MDLALDTLSLPRFNPRDEERERMSLTPDDIASINDDILGLTDRLKRTTISDGAIEKSLSQLDAELEKIPGAAKSAFLEAQRINPQLIVSDEKIDFLRDEDFDAKRAAQRLIQYWDFRKELFGEKFHLPLTPEGALKDDLIALSESYVRLLPNKDAFGRAIILFYPCIYKPNLHSRKSLTRVYFSLLENARKDQEVKEHGFIIIGTPRNTTFDQFDPMFLWKCFQINTLIPLKFRALHICHPDSTFHLALPILKYGAGKRHRERLMVHDGSDEHVLQQLSAYGLPPDCLPVELGGNVSVFGSVVKPPPHVQEENAFETFSKQVRDQRRCLEAFIDGVDSVKCTSNPPDHTPLKNVLKQLNTYDIPPDCAPVELGGNVNGFDSVSKSPRPVQDKKVCENFPKQLPDQHLCLQACIDSIDSAKCTSSSPDHIECHMLPESAKTDLVNHNAYMDAGYIFGGQNSVVDRTKDKIACPSVDKRIHCKEWVDDACCLPSSGRKQLPGRKGDQRMNRAVEAKLSNPSLQMIGALLEGGFIFPHYGKSLCRESEVLDTDGISLMQRKNQLARRLRARRKEGSNKNVSAESKSIAARKAETDSKQNALQKVTRAKTSSLHCSQKRGLNNDYMPSQGQETLSCYSELREINVETFEIDSVGKDVGCSRKQYESTASLNSAGAIVPSRDQNEDGVISTDQSVPYQNPAEFNELDFDDHFLTGAPADDDDHHLKVLIDDFLAHN